MKQQLSALLAGLALVAAGTAPVSAAGATHEFFGEDYDAYEHFAAGEGFCVTWERVAESASCFRWRGRNGVGGGTKTPWCLRRTVGWAEVAG